MRITDCHVHVRGPVEVDRLLRQMDENGVDRVILLSQYERKSLDETRRKMEAAARLVEAAPDRLSALARVEPTIPGMADLAAEALTAMPFSGLKIIPDHWFAYEERLEPFWERMNELGAHILFHTGILYGFEDGSRFNRPLWLEKLLFYPNIRFVMAHISWPWCEECLAVMGRMRAAAGYDAAKWQSYIDLTPGAPRHIRKQAVGNAVDFCGPERIMFGTDSAVGPDLRDSFGEFQKGLVDEYLAILDELGLSESDKERIMSGTADEVFPPRL